MAAIAMAMAMTLPLAQPSTHSCYNATPTSTLTGAGVSRSFRLAASSTVRILRKPKTRRNDEHLRHGAARNRNGTIMCTATASANYEARFPEKAKELEDDWFKQKPLGFGYGKVYDISLEEKLSHQMELDAKAQVALKQKFKEKGRVSVKEKEITAPTPQGTKVWVGKLPKKKNVETDLRKNFRNAQGLLHIEPIEAGDEKTRHPLCKGFAFLTFANKDDAINFMAKWEGENCIFGKVEKKLTFRFAEENTGESTPKTKEKAAFLSKESHLSVPENRSVSMRQAIEAALLLKRQSELQEPQHVGGALRVAGASSPSNCDGLQMEPPANSESTTERLGCILAINETERAASQLPIESIITRNFKDLDARGRIKRESEGPNSITPTIRDTQEDTGNGTSNSGQERNSLNQTVANTDTAIGCHETIDACPQSTLAAEAHISVETAVTLDDHDIEKAIIERNADVVVNPQSEVLESASDAVHDVEEVSPQFQVLESASDAVHYDQISSIHSLEAVDSIDDKDKRIHELELKVRDLERQLQKQVLSTKASLEERTELQQLMSEAGKSTLKTSQNPSALSDTKSSKAKNSQPRSAKRLKKEKQVLANVVSKYVSIR